MSRTVEEENAAISRELDDNVIAMRSSKPEPGRQQWLTIWVRNKDSRLHPPEEVINRSVVLYDSTPEEHHERTGRALKKLLEEAFPGA